MKKAQNNNNNNKEGAAGQQGSRGCRGERALLVTDIGPYQRFGVDGSSGRKDSSQIVPKTTSERVDKMQTQRTN